MKNKKFLFLLSGFFVAIFALAFFVPALVQAAIPDPAATNYGLDTTAQSAGLPMTKDLPTVIGNVLGSALSMISVLFFGLMLFGGMMWMTARGKSENTQKALDLIISAIIGIVIVLAAYAITNFVFSNVISGSGGPTTPPPQQQTQTCTSNLECTVSGQTCNLTTKTCEVAQAGACTQNSDCTAGYGLMCSSGSCVDDPATGFCLSDGTPPTCGQPVAISLTSACANNYQEYSICLSAKENGCIETGCSSDKACSTVTKRCVTVGTLEAPCPIGNECQEPLVCGTPNGASSKSCGNRTKDGELCNNFACEIGDGLRCLLKESGSTFYYCSKLQDIGEVCNGDPTLCATSVCNVTTNKCE
ncbi:MAG: hypothetical protein ACD_18C00064G0008 [uncultured bacterium]|nr:MAG: hypothetical protein ACD_18C00064G0008 [uncultured bacterium]OGH83604.1 MAG: hypothetical protein A2488_03530 [Candidatus Magasanikbacteria bacterium RIFOXYC12_FULL_32_21b]OGH90660.1 MAG: hypothetical protein A2507_01865 [Candidatus Magasanikbacteria bacterium RIFOXYD12_FULL_33_17]HAO52308.1 hypothetical protein [Candidatus Magasanikbacteria bacterium]